MKKIPLNKNWIILLAALIAGGMAALGAKNYIQRSIDEIQSKEKPTFKQVVVAKHDLQKGETLTAAQLAVREVPVTWVSSNAITPEQFSRIEGETLAFPLAAGEPLLWPLLEGEKVPSFSARLELGRRAVTLPVDEVSSISGMLMPEDKIDIVVSLSRDQQHHTFTLLQHVRVLATGTKADPHVKNRQGDPMMYTTVTLDTTPDEAKQLIAARELGRITALLRAPADKAFSWQKTTSTEQLLGLLGKSPYGMSSVPVIYGGGPIKEGLHLQPDEPTFLPTEANELQAASMPTSHAKP